MIVRHTRPPVTDAQALRLVREHYSLDGVVSALPGERDRNFLLRTTEGAELVLKVAGADETRATLELQNRVLQHLAVRVPSLALPRLVPARDEQGLVAVRLAEGAEHYVRLVTYVPGVLWADVRPHPPELLASLGRVLGTLDAGLQDLEDPAARRSLKWDLAQSAWVAPYTRSIGDARRRAMVERHLEAFERDVRPRMSRQRTGIVHNDANDYNVVVGGEPPYDRRVVGIIDFGDLVHTQTVGELAIALAYALMGKPDPLAAARPVVAGYHAVFPLAEAEIELLFPLACLRLCVSVTNAAYQREVEPENGYLTISETAAWELLERLDRVSPSLAHYALREACGLEPCPSSTAVRGWLEAHAGELGPVLAPPEDRRGARPIVFDLGVGSLELPSPSEWPDVEAFSAHLFGRMAAAGTWLGVGRYDEARALYTSDIFRTMGNDGPEWRTVHLAVDLFAAAGTEVLAPLDGVVESSADNAGLLDYGPTVILRHEPADGPRFFTLYGHLGRQSSAGLAAGRAVRRGERIGRIGDASVNGGWPPHVHFQIVLDRLDYRGDFPGVARPRDRAVWLSLSPDPNLVLRLPELVAASTRAAGEPSPPQILDRRRRHLGPSLSLSYRRPLEIVRGYRQHLYDHEGRAYLDAVNNVAHVGHCHPRVVRAGQAQMAVLNTNTRYLHENLARYAERLVATLPEPLRVCFFVSSGSEANELALRLARTHTRRTDTLVLDAAYHGNTTSLVDVSPYKHDGPGGSGPPPHVHKVPMPDVYRGPYRRSDAEAGARYARLVAEAIARLREAGRAPGTFLCEPLLSCGGQIVLPEGFLREAYRAVREAGGVCIADEVQTGFGRVGSHFWGFETQGVVPDVVTMGKPIGNGHPLGAVVTTPEIAASFANGMEYFNTFGGNPVSCAVGLAVLDVIEDEGLQENARDVGGYLLDGLRRLQEDHAIVGDVRGLGLFLGFELVLDRETLAPAAAQASYLANRMRDRGVLLSTDGPFHNVLKIKPPLVFSRDDADRLLDALASVLGEDFLIGNVHKNGSVH